MLIALSLGTCAFMLLDVIPADPTYLRVVVRTGPLRLMLALMHLLPMTLLVVLEKTRQDPLPQWLWWLSAAALVPLLINAASLPPVTSDDMFYYITYGREAMVLGVNPFKVLPRANLFDPIIAEIPRFWFNVPCLYGPLAVALFSALTFFGPDTDLPALVAIFKWGWFLGYLLFMGVFAWALREFKVKYALSTFFGVVCNPMVVWIFVVDAHIDMWPGILTLLTLIFCHRKSFVTAGVLMAMTASLKIMPIFILPFVAVYIYRSQNGDGAIKAFLNFCSGFAVVFGTLYGISGGGELRALWKFSSVRQFPSEFSVLPTFLFAFASHFTGASHVDGVQVVAKAMRLLMWGGLAFGGILTLLWKRLSAVGLPTVTGFVQGWVFICLLYFQCWYVMWFAPLLFLDLKKASTVWLATLVLTLWFIFSIGGSQKAALTNTAIAVTVGMIVSPLWRLVKETLADSRD